MNLAKRASSESYMTALQHVSLPQRWHAKSFWAYWGILVICTSCWHPSASTSLVVGGDLKGRPIFRLNEWFEDDSFATLVRA